MKRKNLALALAAVLMLSFLTACKSSPSSSLPTPPPASSAAPSQASSAPAEPEAFYAFTDALGETVTLEKAPERVAAAMGSFADVWLLAGGELAAATNDAWSADRSLPLAETTVDIGAMKSPSMEQIIEEKIDFVILSAKIEEHVKLRGQLDELGIASAYFEVEVFQDYLDMLKICTDITGRQDLFEENGTAVQSQIDAAIARKEGQEAPTVLFIRAFSTGANAKGSDNMTGAMLKDLGCINIADSDTSLLEDLSMEVIIEQDPDYIFFVTMGESQEKAQQSMKALLEDNPAFAGLSAVKNEQYIMLPKDLFHLKPNNRWGESYEFLADILYPEAK